MKGFYRRRNVFKQHDLVYYIQLPAKEKKNIKSVIRNIPTTSRLRSLVLSMKTV